MEKTYDDILFWAHMLDEATPGESLTEDKAAFAAKVGGEPGFDDAFGKFWEKQLAEGNYRKMNESIVAWPIFRRKCQVVVN